MTYRVGQRVRVADRAHDGHHRTPEYVKGKSGFVERVHGPFTNPETRAYGTDGLPKQRLYLVGFAGVDLGPDLDLGRDRISIDLFEHWLEEAE